MKRSEALKIIVDGIQFFHNHKFKGPFTSYKDFAEVILLNLEDAGIPPPTSVEWDVAFGLIYANYRHGSEDNGIKSIEDCWEPEDE